MVEMNNSYRPEFHFSPAENWMNDPNGLVYYEGEYHLYYQHYPYGMTWGPMHWGHAVSKDMIKWEHLPIALRPDEEGMIFSGSIVVDRNNSSGFFGDASGLVAIYTNTPEDSGDSAKWQSQSIAYSCDKGRTWTKYEGNPVIENPGIKDFRDPKVFWFKPEEKWVMILACGDRVKFYDSKNLKTWEFLSDFGVGEGCHTHVWECPDLFELPIEDETATKWVLKVDVFDGAPAGGSGGQYFIGSFDGTKFENDEKGKYNWLDYGMDFYASQSWFIDDEAESRQLWLAWMSNWKYANETPTETFRGAMTLPRTLKIKRTKEGLRLFQNPICELDKYKKENKHVTDQEIDSENPIIFKTDKNTFVLSAEFDKLEDDFLIEMQKNDGTCVVVRYEKEGNKLFLNRGNSGNSTFHGDFNSEFIADLLPAESIQIEIIVDKCSIEIFTNEGEAIVTNLIFPFMEGGLIKVSTPKRSVRAKYLSLYDISL